MSAFYHRFGSRIKQSIAGGDATCITNGKLCDHGRGIGAGVCLGGFGGGVGICKEGGQLKKKEQVASCFLRLGPDQREKEGKVEVERLLVPGRKNVTSPYAKEEDGGEGGIFVWPAKSQTAGKEGTLPCICIRERISKGRRDTLENIIKRGAKARRGLNISRRKPSIGRGGAGEKGG